MLFVSSLIIWLPVLSPLPELPRLPPLAPVRLPVRVVRRPDDPGVVPHLRRAPAVQGLRAPARSCSGRAALEDQQIAGLIMKLGAGLLLWALIAVIFFRWAADEERHNHPQVRREMDRELSQMGL